MARALAFACICATLLFAGTASAQLNCRADQKDAAVAQLMFGRKIGDRIGVTNAAWTRFLDQEITPRFPAGLTVVDATGQWRDPVRKRVVREPSKLVTIVMPQADEGQKRIDQIVALYKARFRQQSVGVMVRPACVAF